MNFIQSDQWAEEDCPCRGSGYTLSDLKTWHQCPVHYMPGQPHPEEDYGDGMPEPYEPASEDHPDGLSIVGGEIIPTPARQNVPLGDDEIPF